MRYRFPMRQYVSDVQVNESDTMSLDGACIEGDRR